MTDDKQNGESKVQAGNNSVAVGRVQVGGSVDGPMVIGNNNVINNFKSPEQTETLNLINEKIDIQNIEPETVLIPTGSFWMGFDPGEGIDDYDTPRHQVTLPAYRIGKYPVTNSQYYRFVLDGGGVNPEMDWVGRNIREGLEDIPVVGVKFDDALRYCEWLNEMTDRKYVKYTLPNEAQLDRAYQGNHCSDTIANIYQWTCTLWGAKGSAPDVKYRYPWKDDLERNNVLANSQVRRVVCIYPEQGMRQRSGEFPGVVGFPGARHSFRVVLNQA